MQLLQVLQQALTTLQGRTDSPLSTEAANSLRQLLINLIPTTTPTPTAANPAPSALSTAQPMTATVLQIQNQQVLLQLAGQQFSLPINQLPLAAQTPVGSPLWLQVFPAAVQAAAVMQITQLAPATADGRPLPATTMPAQLLPATANSAAKLSIAGTQITLPPQVAQTLNEVLANQPSRALAIQLQVLPPAVPTAAPQLQLQALLPSNVGAQGTPAALANWQQPLLNLPRTLVAKLPAVLQKTLPLPIPAKASPATPSASATTTNSGQASAAPVAGTPTPATSPTPAVTGSAPTAITAATINAIHALLPLRANMLGPTELLQRLPLLQQQLATLPAVTANPSPAPTNASPLTVSSQANTTGAATTPVAATVGSATNAVQSGGNSPVTAANNAADNGADIVRALIQQLTSNIQPTQPQQLEQLMNQWFAARPLSLNPSQSLGGLGQLLLMLLGAKLAQTTSSTTTAQNAAQWSQTLGSQLAQQLSAGLQARTPAAANAPAASVASPSAALLSALTPQLLQNLIQTVAGSMNAARMSQAQLVETARAGTPDYHLLVPMHGQQPYQQAELLVQRRKHKRRRGEVEEDIWLFKLRMPLARYGPVLVKGSYQHSQTKIQFVTESLGARVHIQEHLRMLDARFKALQLSQVELSAIRGKVPEQLQELSGNSIHLQV